MISRLSSCYDRYWSGVTHTVAMYDKWLQAVSHAIAFESAAHKASPDEAAQQTAYIKHLMKLFTQLSVVAVLKLHSGMPSTGEWLALGSAECRHGITRYSGLRKSDTRNPGVSSAGAEESDEHVDSTTRKLASFTHAHHDRHQNGHADDRGVTRRRMATRRERRESRSSSIVDGALEDSALFKLKELTALMQSGDPVNLMANRIHRKSLEMHYARALCVGLSVLGPHCRTPHIGLSWCTQLTFRTYFESHLHVGTGAITSRNQGQGWKIPPPIYNRVFQELAEGLTSYHAALKLKLVPVPFGYVQLTALLLLCAIFLAPVSIACFSSTYSMSVWLSTATVGGFVAMCVHTRAATCERAARVLAAPLPTMLIRYRAVLAAN